VPKHAVLLIPAALLAGCFGGSANLEFNEVSVGHVICTDSGVAFTEVEYTLWNAGPESARNIKTTHQVRVAPNENYSGREAGKHIPALPVDASRAFTDYVTISPTGCPGEVGDVWEYFIILNVNPANGPETFKVGYGKCAWTAFTYIEGIYCRG
jgi:hypothetical protein